MDGLYDLYNTAQERENVITTAVKVTEGKNLNAEEILADLGSLSQTGIFNSNEEALEFDANLRQFLYNSGKSKNEVSALMPQIFASMQSGTELPDTIVEMISNSETTGYLFNSNIDGNKDEASWLDFKSFLAHDTVKKHISDQFGSKTFSQKDQDAYREMNTILGERVVNTDYNDALSPEQAKIWYSVAEDVSEKIKSSIGDDGKVHLTKVSLLTNPSTSLDFGVKPYSNFTEFSYIQGETGFNDVYRQLLEESNRKYKEGTYVSSGYTKEQIDAHNKNKQIAQSTSTGNTDKTTGQETQLGAENPTLQTQISQDIIDMYNAEFTLLETIGKNVELIYANTTPTTKYDPIETFKKNIEQGLKYIAEVNLLNAINNKIDDIYSAVVYAPGQVSGSQFEFIPMVKSNKESNSKQNSSQDYSNINYETLLDNVMSKYSDMYGNYDKESMEYTNTITMLRSLKDEVLFNTQISTTDLMVDIEMASKEQDKTLLWYIVDLLQELKRENKVQNSNKNVQVLNTGGNDVVNYNFMNAFSKNVRNTNGIVTSILT